MSGASPKDIPDFRLIDRGWDQVFDGAVARNHSSIQILCPFIKHSTVKRLLQAGQPHHLQVITRFNLRDFYDQVSDISALTLLLENGAKIRGLRGLHSKLYLFGEEEVIVTSANLTEAALLRNSEFGFISRNQIIVAHCQSYFEQLWKAASPDVTDDRIKTWQVRLERAWARGGRPADAIRLGDEGVALTNTVPSVVLPSAMPETTQSFVKFFGEGDNRAEYSRGIFDQIKHSGCHWACTYPKGKRPRRVKEGAMIFMARMVKKPDDVIIFGRAIAMRYKEGRDDATRADISTRNWKQKWPHYIRVHHGEFLAGTLHNGVSLNALIQSLGSMAFESTKENSIAGGNTNPRRAYRQQADVRLTPEAHLWLSERLERAFEEHGKLTAAELETLDWPEVPQT